jgi:hypothetical protein
MYGTYQNKVIVFDSSLLNTGTNEITLTLLSENHEGHVIYDYLRLEIRNKSDINGDGKVNLIDLSIVAKDWQGCTNPADADCVNMGNDPSVKFSDVDVINLE